MSHNASYLHTVPTHYRLHSTGSTAQTKTLSTSDMSNMVDTSCHVLLTACHWTCYLTANSAASHAGGIEFKYVEEYPEDRDGMFLRNVGIYLPN